MPKSNVDVSSINNPVARNLGSKKRNASQFDNPSLADGEPLKKLKE
jgi:hypothetical protein